MSSTRRRAARRYGAEYIQGLRLGLDYATNGTNKVAGDTIELTAADDAGDPAKAVSAAKDLIGKGYKIIGGSTSPASRCRSAPIAAQNKVLFISGPAATDGITGLNKYTFRSGRQTYQDVAGGELVPATSPARTWSCSPRTTSFGQGNVAAVKAVLGGKGATVDKVLVPLTATDFTPFAAAGQAANPDLLFVAWAGTTAAGDVAGARPAGRPRLDDGRHAAWPSGRPGRPSAPPAPKIKFLSHYVFDGPTTRSTTGS